MDRNAMDKAKRRLCNTIVMLVLLLFGFCLVGKLISIPMFHVKDKTITRNLGWLILPMDEEPNGRTVAWDSELPDFVETDIQYAEEHGYKIEYEFKGNIISIQKREERWRISLKTRIDNGIEWDSLENFSMYQTKDHKIVIYGYCFPNNEWFQKITLQKNNTSLDTITYNKNLPLDEFSGAESIGAIKVGEYWLVQKKQTFIFYQDGQQIVSQDFGHGTIENVNFYRGTVLAGDNKLYKISAELVEEMPKLIFTYVDTVDKIVEAYPYRSGLRSIGEEPYSLELVQKNGKYCAAVPNDWESFDKFALSQTAKKLYPRTAEFDYSAKLVELETSLSEVNFNCTDNGLWYATIIFDLNGRKFYSEYWFDGYDNSVKIPENVEKAFTNKKITSFDQMWEAISDIRDIYFNYYEKREDFVS